MYIGKKLQVILERGDFSVAELSEKSEIDGKTLEDILEERKEPTLDEFINIANGLSISPNELLEDRTNDIEEKLLEVQMKIRKLSEKRREEMLCEIEKFFDKNHN